jgi:hypothetical protein
MAGGQRRFGRSLSGNGQSHLLTPLDLLDHLLQ